MLVFTGPHIYIMFAHLVIQMKMGLTTKPHILGYWLTVLQRHLEAITEVNSPGFISHMKVLLHLNCAWKQFHIFLSYPVCWWCSPVELWHNSQISWDSASMPAQHTECFLVIWQTSCYWQHSSYCWLHSQSLQINMFIMDLVGVFLHSNFIQNSCWTTITLAVW
jgi:hypothetical protein